MTAARQRHPEIDSGPIRRPLFIIGLPRTGTSILHEFLAEDPANRVPMTWEVMHPWPAPERATYETDPRIAQVERHLAGVDRIVPGFKAMHPMGARLPQECVALTAHDFATMICMRRFLAANPKDKHGAHRYTLAAAGFGPAVERRRYAAYQEHFRIPSEPGS